MPRKKTKEQIKKNMSNVRNRDTQLENKLCSALVAQGIHTFTRNDKSVLGKPDIVFKARKIAIFCDGDFWHGYNWNVAKNEIKSNRDFWISKIEKNIARDQQVTQGLQAQGWTVLRFWGHELVKELPECVAIILDELRTIPQPPYRTIDLCAGIGGIRRGFELTGQFVNVLSSEIDKYACKTYQHIFGDNPERDLTTDEFKNLVDNTGYEVLLAGFPCQTFSSVGLQEGFQNEEKGQIFFHIAEIMKRTRPIAFFLENVERLVTHDAGNTFRTIINTLITELGYYVIGVETNQDGSFSFSQRNFVRNSRDFGVPQNRPRTYLIGFDSIASLSERLYCSEEDDGKKMAGIFIYTASGDSEGTLGGLVRQGRPDAFPRIIKKAIASAKTCSNDPVCILSRGQGRDSLNLAACHACGLLPETCCEERNAFLDRGLVIGTYDNQAIGFWNDLMS